MLFRFLLLLSLIGALTVFTVQNLTLTPLVFLGIPLPALPLSLWVLGAIAAGALSIWVIQGLYRLSAFVNTAESSSSGRSPKRREAATTADRNPGARQRSRWESPRRDHAASPDPYSPDLNPLDDRDPAPRWQDHRRESSPATPSRDRPTAPSDDWERPVSRDWDGSATAPAPEPTPESRDHPRESAPREDTARDYPSRESTPRDYTSRESVPPAELPDFEDEFHNAPAYPQDPPPKKKSASERVRDRRATAQDIPQRETPRRSEYYDDEPNEPRRDRPAPSNPADQVVDADYRVIVPPYTPLSELIKETPPPPEPEENADDWFDDPPDDFEPSPKQ